MTSTRFRSLGRRASLLAILLIASCASPVAPASNQSADVAVSVGGAFASLDRADVYDENGALVTTIGQETGFKARLPIGRYHVDFIDDAGNHSFLDDGRIAFVPTMDGGLPLGGPVTLPGVDSKLWEVQVHPDLEGNAHLMERVRQHDPKLMPWASALGMEVPNQQPDGLVGLTTGALHTFGGNVAAMRARVIWEASFAMKGDYYAGCNSSDTCWTGNANGAGIITTGRTNPFSGGTYYSYLDFDPTAWSKARTAYLPTSGNVSCKDATPVPTGCQSAYTSADARQYTCQGTCSTSGNARGGQCKVFNNLILFRAGIMHAASGATDWLSLPLDSQANHSPFASSTTLSAGDVLRNTGTIHSTLVVTAPGGNQYRVVDSNWVGTAGYEEIGSHIMSFSGTTCPTPTLGNLNCYHNLTCVYSSGDNRCP
ncbi:MAG: hypothetical protein RLZZ324_610 [Candidatus Parcubacteria bacterium]